MIMEPTLVEPEEVEEALPQTNLLTKSDRCDTCGAEAFYWAFIPNADAGLLFCCHHFKKAEIKIREIALDIVDESYKLNVKASASSPD